MHKKHPLSDAEQFLLNFHAQNPGCTVHGFGGCTTPSGTTSYDVLVENLPHDTRILDLGCGDGFMLERCIDAGHLPDHLFGIDLSPAELALARQRLKLNGVQLEAGRAQDLPHSDASLDVVLSHLVLMLVGSVAPVISEIARVLKPGGNVRAIMGGGPAVVPNNAIELFVECLNKCACDSEPLPQMGDTRLRKLGGLHATFAADGRFEDIQVKPIYVSKCAPFDDVWLMMTTLYEMNGLDTTSRVVLKDTFRDRCASIADAEGLLTCTWALTRVSARRI
jgi:SAM-dependent methyltransferase